MMALLMSLLMASAQAQQSLPDPTQPPPGAQTSSAPEGAAPVVAPALLEPQLQSILIGKKANGRKLALIDGQLFKVGDKVREMKLMAIEANRVILRNGKTTKVLKLWAESAPPAPAKQ